MSVSPNPSPSPGGIPGLERAPVRRPRPRHALGLPAGSVRALLALMVLATLATLVLLNKQNDAPLLFLYLQYLMFLILAHFFTAHGNSIGTPEVSDRSPLGLPRGSIRFLLLFGFAGLTVWTYLHQPSYEEAPKAPVVLPLFLMGGFLAGLLVSFLITRPLARRGYVPAWFQDLQAWVSLLAMLGLVAEVLLQVFINPSLEPEKRLDLTQWEGILAALVGFYFGARS